jgi:hypothetical protein
MALTHSLMAARNATSSSKMETPKLIAVHCFRLGINRQHNIHARVFPGFTKNFHRTTEVLQALLRVHFAFLCGNVCRGLAGGIHP